MEKDCGGDMYSAIIWRVDKKFSYGRHGTGSGTGKYLAKGIPKTLYQIKE